MRGLRSVKIICVLVLLAVVVSYSLDLECFLESQACHQVQITDQELDRSCAQPTTLPVVAAILPAQPYFRLPAPIIVERVTIGWPEPERARRQLRLLPLGLRAPPIA